MQIWDTSQTLEALRHSRVGDKVSSYTFLSELLDGRALIIAVGCTVSLSSVSARYGSYILWFSTLIKSASSFFFFFRYL